MHFVVRVVSIFGVFPFFCSFAETPARQPTCSYLPLSQKSPLAARVRQANEDPRPFFPPLQVRASNIEGWTSAPP